MLVVSCCSVSVSVVCWYSVECVGSVWAGLTRQGVESAGGEEVSVEVDVHVAEEEQNVASLPGSGPQVQTPAPGKLLVQLDQSVVLKIVLPIMSEKMLERNEYESV